MNDDETILKIMEATAIAEVLKLLIAKLHQAEAYQHDESYRALLAFLSNLHWRHYQIQTSCKFEYDIFGRLHIKDDNTQKMNFN